MAKDDYHIIVYQILEYLYQCLKSGTFPNTANLTIFREQANIHNKYWQYVLIHLLESGYVEETIMVPILL